MLIRHLAKENQVIKQAANQLQELADSDLEAVSGGTGSDGESGSPSPSELAQFTAAAQEFALFTSTVGKALEGANEGSKKVASP